MKTLNDILGSARSSVWEEVTYYAVQDLVETLAPGADGDSFSDEGFIELTIGGKELWCVSAEAAAALIGRIAAGQQTTANFKDKLAAALLSGSRRKTT